jgi:spoIIIJ-associated protein
MNNSNEEAIQFAKKYLEDLLSFFGLNTDVQATNDDDLIQLNIPSTHMNGFLIGQRGENMRAFQYLTSLTLKNKEYSLTRINVDVAEYKKQRANRLKERAETWVKEVKKSKTSKDLEPMNAADRRVIHQLASEYGIKSESRGEGRDRHIVLSPED